MLLHPAFFVGLALGPLLLFGLVGHGDSAAKNLAYLISMVLIGSAFGTIFTANLASLRPRRDNVRELFGALPAPPEARTVGLFVGLLCGPVVLSILLTAVGFVAFRAYDKTAPSFDLFVALQIPLAVASLGAIGIAVGRWIPTLLGGVFIVLAHLSPELGRNAPWIQSTSSGIIRPWHIVYLLAAFAMWAALSLARDRRTLWRFAIAAGAFALGVYAAVQQIPQGGFR